MATEPFVVLTTQRTGSTWLIDSLNDHPEIVAYSELFLDGRRGQPDWGARDLVCWHEHHLASGAPEGEERRTLLDAYLGRIYRPRRRARAAGFKLMYGQAGAIPDLLEDARRRGSRVVHLVREHHLRTVLSRELAVRRDLFHAEHDDGAPPATIRVNPGELIAKMEELEAEVDRWRRRVGELDLPVLEVAYERLAADPATFEPLLSFLGVEEVTRPLQSRLRRVLPRDWRELIENLDELEAALQRSRWADQLTAGEPHPASDAAPAL